MGHSNASQSVLQTMCIQDNPLEEQAFLHYKHPFFYRVMSLSSEMHPNFFEARWWTLIKI